MTFLASCGQDNWPTAIDVVGVALIILLVVGLLLLLVYAMGED